MKTSNEIWKPVFILGPERSGTTLLYSLLANVDEFYWFSRIDSLVPSWPSIGELGRRFFRILDRKPFIAQPGAISGISGLNSPSECNPYWQKYFGWGSEKQYLVENDRFTEKDLATGQKEYILRSLQRRVRYAGKKRLLLKQPGFSLKLTFWNRVFPDAIYLICVRNIDDNLSSLVRAKKKSREKFWGTKVEGWKDYIDTDYHLQATFQLKKIYSGISRDLKNRHLAKQCMVISYDHLISNPKQYLMKVLQFCDVHWNERVESAIRGINRGHLPVDSKVDFSMPAPQILSTFQVRAESSFDKAVQVHQSSVPVPVH